MKCRNCGNEAQQEDTECLHCRSIIERCNMQANPDQNVIATVSAATANIPIVVGCPGLNPIQRKVFLTFMFVMFAVPLGLALFSFVLASLLGCELGAWGGAAGACIRTGIDFSGFFDMSYVVYIIFVRAVTPLLLVVMVLLLIVWVAIPAARRAGAASGGLNAVIAQSRYRYAGFWRRLWAVLIDFSPVVCAILLIDYADNSARVPAAYTEKLLFLPAGLALTFTLLWLVKLYSPGKRLMSLSIADSLTLNPPGRLKLVSQYFSGLLLGIGYGVGPLWILFNRRKQGLHDLLAGTVVLYDTQRKQHKDFLYTLLVLLCLVYALFIVRQYELARPVAPEQPPVITLNSAILQAGPPTSPQ